MAKAWVIEHARMRHAFKVAAAPNQTSAREVAPLHALRGTGISATEVARDR